MKRAHSYSKHVVPIDEVDWYASLICESDIQEYRTHVIIEDGERKFIRGVWVWNVCHIKNSLFIMDNTLANPYSTDTWIPEVLVDGKWIPAARYLCEQWADIAEDKKRVMRLWKVFPDE